MIRALFERSVVTTLNGYEERTALSLEQLDICECVNESVYALTEYGYELALRLERRYMQQERKTA
ncbi:hypothetical protein GCM10007377_15680 [Galliscardovia ingluviei]|uniref:Uncharacterized protein n=2 Tax=Galliscardovia ingluviei TaxID=1769422 RepID=A0A8J3EZX5_9BIFI|nr:hypothetical protein GCM10007377_15680 [Galliscardovia ingluviei]